MTEETSTEDTSTEDTIRDTRTGIELQFEGNYQTTFHRTPTPMFNTRLLRGLSTVAQSQEDPIFEADVRRNPADFTAYVHLGKMGFIELIGLEGHERSGHYTITDTGRALHQSFQTEKVYDRVLGHER